MELRSGDKHRRGLAPSHLVAPVEGGGCHAHPGADGERSPMTVARSGCLSASSDILPGLAVAGLARPHAAGAGRTHRVRAGGYPARPLIGGGKGRFTASAGGGPARRNADGVGSAAASGGSPVRRAHLSGGGRGIMRSLGPLLGRVGGRNGRGHPLGGGRIISHGPLPRGSQGSDRTPERYFSC